MLKDDQRFMATWMINGNQGKPKNSFQAITPHSIVADYLDDHRKPVKIFANGTVSYLHKFYAEVTCKLELSHFPFDRQVCPIFMMAMSFDFTEISMTTEIEDMELKCASTAQWILESVKTDVTLYNYSTNLLDIATFSLSIRRQPLYYLHVIVLPWEQETPSILSST
ncbi:unnamed protein product, partial [Mesorhabditis belari]|uniref:Neurotransmitter-gated ion-channel ligand-binding domain-containing protein n=1 Tax=Mesorhabditis belari TaxID=2138241 RepID=A0AAF3ECS0_9BILA